MVVTQHKERLNMLRAWALHDASLYRTFTETVIKHGYTLDGARRRERDEPFPIQAQGPQNLNRLLADVLVVFIQEVTLRGESFHPAGRNHRLHGCFLSVSVEAQPCPL